MQIGVVLAAGQRGFLEIRRRVAVCHQLEDALALGIEFHDGSLSLLNRHFKSFFPIAGRMHLAYNNLRVSEVGIFNRENPIP
jgi:hypothetical protein